MWIVPWFGNTMPWRQHRTLIAVEIPRSDTSQGSTSLLHVSENLKSYVRMTSVYFYELATFGSFPN